jgi:hypothetical protein
VTYYDHAEMVSQEMVNGRTEVIVCTSDLSVIYPSV